MYILRQPERGTPAGIDFDVGSNDLFHVDVPGDATFDGFKKIVEECLGIPVAQQRQYLPFVERDNCTLPPSKKVVTSSTWYVRRSRSDNNTLLSYFF